MNLSKAMSLDWPGKRTRFPYLGMLLISAGYYFGSILGFALTFQPLPLSLFWPPNAILMAGLLIFPIRCWPQALTVVFVAHLATQLDSGVPLDMILGWFFSNSCEAMIGALGIKAVLKHRLRFDSFRDVIAFLCFGAFLAPLASSFLDVALVKLFGWGEGGYWELWRLRFFSNVVAILIVVPPILSCRREIIWPEGKASLHRQTELAMLLLSLVGVCAVTLSPGEKDPTSLPLLLFAPLPLLLWAALRFNAFCATASFLVLSCSVMWATLQGQGPFSEAAPAANALSMQLFLIGMAIPLQMLAAAIHERLRSLEELRSKDEKLRLALDASCIGTWDWDVRERQGNWSTELQKMFGFEHAGPSMSFAPFLELVHRDDRKGLRKILANAVATGSAIETEFRIVRPDGEVRWVMSKGAALLDDEGNPVRILGVNVDITERKAAEAIAREQSALHESEARFRQMADAVPQIVWAAQSNGCVDYANRKWQELTGLDACPNGDAAWLPYIHPEDRGAYLRGWYGAVANIKPFELECRIQFSDRDGYRWHLMRALPVLDETGSPTRWYGTSTDINEQKHAEHALQTMQKELEQTVVDRTSELYLANAVLKEEIDERRKAEEAERMSEARFAKVFRLSPDAMSISTEWDGEIRDVNERWLKLFGYERTEVIGKTPRQLNLYVSGVEVDAIGRWIKKCGYIRDHDVEVHDKAMDIRQTILSGEAIAIGEEECFITVIRDVTEQRRAQIEAQQQHELLTHLTRVVVLGELSGAVAHELNQPLAAILTNAQAARRFMAGDVVDMQEIRNILDDIVEEDKRAGEVIRRLRALFKRGEPKLLPVNANEIVSDSLALARGDLIARKVRVVPPRPHPGLMVRGDPVQLQQVILNLILNACDSMSASPETGRILTCAIDLAADGHVRIAVSDTGEGMAPDVIGRVFDSFFTTKVHGLGFGLSISRAIIASHGGRIEAINNLERGATFRITLPIYSGELQ